MHLRNPYRIPPDFDDLCLSYPALAKYIKKSSSGTSYVDFKDGAAQRCLTKALLKRDFGLVMNIPIDRLCPPVPNRLNYVLWIQDIIRRVHLALNMDVDARVKGVDIGVGASAIYPLLICSLADQWEMIGTDIDDTSLSYARYNIIENSLEERITLEKVDTEGPIFGFFESMSENLQIDFTMCNPPFYSSHEDMQRSADAKELVPFAVCTGSDNEMITDGGEVRFVERMIGESGRLRARCRWYTTMLGKLSSLSKAISCLQEYHIENYAVTEFVQGQTRRWAVGWSFSDIRLADSVARISNPSLHNLMPPRNTLRKTFSFSPAAIHSYTSQEWLHNVLLRVLTSIEGIRIDTILPRKWYEPSTALPLNPDPPETTSLLVHVPVNSWSRAARRKRRADTRPTMEHNSPRLRSTEISPQTEALALCIIYWNSPWNREPEMTTKPSSLLSRVVFAELTCDWVRGWDRLLFEGFWGHVSRKVGELLAKDNRDV